MLIENLDALKEELHSKGFIKASRLIQTIEDIQVKCPTLGQVLEELSSLAVLNYPEGPEKEQVKQVAKAQMAVLGLVGLALVETK